MSERKCEINDLVLSDNQADELVLFFVDLGNVLDLATRQLMECSADQGVVWTYSVLKFAQYKLGDVFGMVEKEREYDIRSTKGGDRVRQ
jgi:hypothetical protein